MANPGFVQNADALCRTGWREGRHTLLMLLEEALEQADPAEAVRREVQRDGDTLVIGGKAYPIAAGRVHFLGVGKASAPIAEAVEAVVGDALAGGLLVVKRGQASRVERIEVMAADHPVPTLDSYQAALALVRYARQRVHPGDLVICGITGGSSSLASLPPPEVPWEAKVELHRRLLASGMPIQEINAVRKHVSAIKGGRLAAAMPEARVVNLTVSDVADDPPDLITDPTVVDTSTYDEAREILHRYGLWDGVHPAIRRRLTEAGDPAPALPQVLDTRLLVTGTHVAERVKRVVTAHYRGLGAEIFSTAVAGEARDVGRVLAAYARERVRRREPRVVILAGGETTVTLPADDLGEGGPNLELALAFATEVRGLARVALVSVDSDGNDGSTRLAGGLVDGDTVRDPAAARDALARHRTLALADAWGFGVLTGQTRTNVNDITLMLIG
jgi:glycerate 2-kinase